MPPSQESLKPTHNDSTEIPSDNTAPQDPTPLQDNGTSDDSVTSVLPTPAEPTQSRDGVEASSRSRLGQLVQGKSKSPIYTVAIALVALGIAGARFAGLIQSPVLGAICGVSALAGILLMIWLLLSNTAHEQRRSTGSQLSHILRVILIAGLILLVVSILLVMIAMANQHGAANTQLVPSY
jgi:hypothetical protein